MQRPKMSRLVLCSFVIIALVPGAVLASDAPPVPDRVGPVDPMAGISLHDLSEGNSLNSTMALTEDGWLLAQASDEPVGFGIDVLGYKPKSPRRAFLQSLLIPGWGQWYNGSRIKPILFLGLEAAGWMSWSNFRGNGDDIEDAYEIYADEHWTYDRYQNGLESVYDIEIDTLPYTVFVDGVPVERVFSHHIYPVSPDPLPVKDLTYYENVGKYDQFTFGWDDFNDGVPVEEPADTAGFGDAGKWVSPNRKIYLQQRDDANREFNKASTVLILTISNHLLAAFEAAWSARRYNRAIDQFGSIDTDLRLTQSATTGKLMPSFAVRYHF